MPSLHSRFRTARLALAGLALAGLAAVALAGEPAPDRSFTLAQADPAPAAADPAAAPAVDPAVMRLGKTVWGPKGNCSFCHGWGGHGEPEGPSPPGPSLRVTTLTAEQIHEVVQCGRPGTAMPFHDPRAYRDDRCYGVTKDDLGDQMPTKGVSLQPREIDAVVAYIMAAMVGKGPVTADECREFFGSNVPRCAQYEG